MPFCYDTMTYMANDLDTRDVLTDKLVEERVRGRSYGDIARKHGIPAEEVIRIIRAELESVTIRDPQEYRALLQLRTEAIIDKLWDGLEVGSFKHGEAILKAVNTLQELHDLNEKTIVHQINVILDEDATKVFDVLKIQNSKMLEKVLQLKLTPHVKKELEQWPEWAAETATEAVEQVVYAEEIEED